MDLPARVDTVGSPLAAEVQPRLGSRAWSGISSGRPVAATGDTVGDPASGPELCGDEIKPAVARLVIESHGEQPPVRLASLFDDLDAVRPGRVRLTRAHRCHGSSRSINVVVPCRQRRTGRRQDEMLDHRMTWINAGHHSIIAHRPVGHNLAPSPQAPCHERVGTWTTPRRRASTTATDLPTIEAEARAADPLGRRTSSSLSLATRGLRPCTPGAGSPVTSERSTPRGGRSSGYRRTYLNRPTMIE